MSDAVKAVGNIFSPPKPKEMAIQATPAMGTFQQKLASRQAVAADRKKKKGRESTINTGGGTTYSQSGLGGTR